jgi:hypothetical protein
MVLVLGMFSCNGTLANIMIEVKSGELSGKLLSDVLLT